MARHRFAAVRIESALVALVRRNGNDDAPVVQREVTLVAGETADVTLEAPK